MKDDVPDERRDSPLKNQHSLLVNHQSEIQLAQALVEAEADER